MLTRRVVDGILSVGASAAGVATLRLVQLMVLARLLSPDSFGVVTMAMVAITLLTHFSEVGAGSVVTQRQRMSGESVSALFWVGIAVALACGGFALLTRAALAEHFDEPRVADVIEVLCVVPFLGAVSAPYRALLERELSFRLVGACDLAGSLAGACVAIVTATLGAGVLALAWGAVTTALTSGACLVWSGQTRWRPSMRLSAPGLGADIRFGVQLAGQRLVNFVAGNADFFLVGTLLGSHALGLYAIAFNLANLPSSQVNAIINRVSFPAMSRVQTDRDRLTDAYMKFHGASSALNWPLMLGLAVVASDLLPLVLGPAWSESVPLFQVLCLMGIARGLAGTVGPLLLARGETARGLRWSILVACTVVPVLWCGVVWRGVFGLAIAYALFQVLLLAPNYTLLVRPILGPCLRAYALASTFAAAPALVAALAMAASGFATQLNAVATVLVEVTIGAAVYLGLLAGLFGSQVRANLALLKRRVPEPTHNDNDPARRP